jgi:hypothetical protein
MRTSDKSIEQPGSGRSGGVGPLAGSDLTGRPIDDPAMADRANPRWDDPSAPRPDAQSAANPDGTPNVMPADDVILPVPDATERELGTTQDQAARPLEPEVGRNTIAEGRGGGTPNPALAEGGEAGEGG